MYHNESFLDMMIRVHANDEPTNREEVTTFLSDEFGFNLDDNGELEMMDVGTSEYIEQFDNWRKRNLLNSTIAEFDVSEIRHCFPITLSGSCPNGEPLAIIIDDTNIRSLVYNLIDVYEEVVNDKKINRTKITVEDLKTVCGILVNDVIDPA